MSENFLPLAILMFSSSGILIINILTEAALAIRAGRWTPFLETRTTDILALLTLAMLVATVDPLCLFVLLIPAAFVVGCELAHSEQAQQEAENNDNTTRSTGNTGVPHLQGSSTAYNMRLTNAALGHITTLAKGEYGASFFAESPEVIPDVGRWLWPADHRGQAIQCVLAMSRISSVHLQMRTHMMRQLLTVWRVTGGKDHGRLAKVIEKIRGNHKIVVTYGLFSECREVVIPGSTVWLVPVSHILKAADPVDALLAFPPEHTLPTTGPFVKLDIPHLEISTSKTWSTARQCASETLSGDYQEPSSPLSKAANTGEKKDRSQLLFTLGDDSDVGKKGPLEDIGEEGIPMLRLKQELTSIFETGFSLSEKSKASKAEKNTNNFTRE